MSFASRRNAGTSFTGGPTLPGGNSAPLSSALLGGAVPGTISAPGTAPSNPSGMPAATQPTMDIQPFLDAARLNPAQPNANLQQLLQQAQQPQPQPDPSAPAFDPQQWQAMLQQFRGLSSPMSAPTSNPWFPSQGLGSTGSGTAAPWWLNRG